jgi:serine/threonine protein kinase/tetratricopeptide (TPR) repeat protein
VASLIGKEIGKYRITERIGRGGMAEVYLGIHTHLDRKVAVKVLHSHLLEGGDFVARFKREAKAVANLRHPNIVQVHDFDIQDELIFMVMEYIDGENLHAKLVEVGNRGERLPIKLIGSIINDIAGALDYAHAQGMLHRDIKPSNILLDKNDKAFLTDFGIAKLLDDQKFTATGQLVGTPAYMSPEQGMGEDLTEESDIYSLGIVAFEMLTGQVPYDAKTPIGIVHKQINDPVPNLSELVDGMPGTAQDVLNRALAKTPEGRYNSAEALVGALRTALQALESTEPIMKDVPEKLPDLEDKDLDAPTITMQDPEMGQATVVMQDQKAKPQAAPPPPEEKTPPAAKQPVSQKTGEKKKLPLWAYIAGGVALVAIAVVLITQVFSLGGIGSSTGNTIEVSVDAAKGTDGLSIQAFEDGDFEYVTIGDLAGWRTGSGRPLLGSDGNSMDDLYLYFQIDDQIINQLPPGADVVIDVEYQDQGTDSFVIHYDAHDGGPSNDGRFKDTGVIHKTDTGEFRTARFELANPFFSNRINGADFRLFDLGDGHEIIRNVTLTYKLPENQDQPPGQGSSVEGEEFFNQGFEHFEAGRYEEALDMFHQALENGYESAELFNYMGRANRWLDNFEVSLDDFTRAIELDENGAWYWFNRGRSKLDLEDFYGAIDDINVAAELDPDSWLFLHTLGEAYYYTGDQNLIGDAHFAFDRAIEIQPDNSLSYQILGEMLWFGNRDLEAALGWLNIAVEKADPSDPGPYHLRGVIYKESEQFELCIPDFDEFVIRDPENPWAYKERGDCFVGLGDQAAARQDYQHFMSVSEGNPEFLDIQNQVQAWLDSNP